MKAGTLRIGGAAYCFIATFKVGQEIRVDHIGFSGKIISVTSSSVLIETDDGEITMELREIEHV